MQKSFIPMITAFVGILTNVGLSILLTPRIGLLALAIATVAAGFVMTVVLSLFSLKVSKKIFVKPFFLEMLKLLFAGLCSFGVCKISLALLDFNSTVLIKIVFTLLTLVVSLIVYILILVFVKSENLSIIKSVIRKGDKTSDV